MRKKGFGLILAVFVAIFPMFVNAEEIVKVGTEDELRTALENGKSVELTSDIVITKPSTKSITNCNNKGCGGIAITGEGKITIDGNGHKIDASAMRTTLEVYSNDDKEFDVTFTDIKINNGYNGGRALDTRDNITLTLNGVTLTTTGSGNNQVLTIGGTYATTMNINILNSSISDGISGYGIITFNKVNLTIDNSKVSGYGSLYIKEGAAGSLITIKNNSVLSTDNVHSALTNAFATVIFEEKDITMNIENSTIKAVSTGEQPQYAFLFRKENCKVNATGISTIEVDTKEELASGNTINITLNEGFTSNVEVPTDYLAKSNKEEDTTKVFEVVDTETNTSKYVVATEEDVISIPYEKDMMTAKEFEEELLKLEKTNSTEAKELLADIQKILTGKKVVSAHDIYFGSFVFEELIKDTNKTELDKNVKVTLNIPEDLEKVKEGYTRKYVVIRLHEIVNNNTTKIEVNELKSIDNGDGTVTFETDKFSTYILTYEDIKNTTNPQTFDGIGLYIIIGGLTLIGLITVNLLQKNKILTNQ